MRRIVDGETSADVDPYHADLPLPRPSGRVVEREGDRIVDVGQGAPVRNPLVGGHQLVQRGVGPRVSSPGEIGNQHPVAVPGQVPSQSLDE